jgi:glucose-1-phosphate adenylyltransferase
MIETHRVYAYDFMSNLVPGVGPHEEHGYWLDVGPVNAYLAARRDLFGPSPPLCVDNPAWPIRSGSTPPNEVPDGGDPHERGAIAQGQIVMENASGRAAPTRLISSSVQGAQVAA